MLPCVIFEDEHLLVVNKPAGLNTHAPGPFAGEGIYDWLKHREPRWAALAIMHRLDKETSGVMVFGKTPRANRSLTEQFTAHAIRKTYLLLTDRPVRQKACVVRTSLIRAGRTYVEPPARTPAVTRPRRGFNCRGYHERRSGRHVGGGRTAHRPHPPDSRPRGGRAASRSSATRFTAARQPRAFCLHAAELAFKHPATGEER